MRMPSNVGDRQLANMATALLKDVAIEFPNFTELDPERNENMIVGRAKVRGERRRICKSLTEAPVKDTFSIAFDGNHMESKGSVKKSESWAVHLLIR